MIKTVGLTYTALLLAMATTVFAAPIPLGEVTIQNLPGEIPQVQLDSEGLPVNPVQVTNTNATPKDSTSSSPLIVLNSPLFTMIDPETGNPVADANLSTIVTLSTPGGSVIDMKVVPKAPPFDPSAVVAPVPDTPVVPVVQPAPVPPVEPDTPKETVNDNPIVPVPAVAPIVAPPAAPATTAPGDIPPATVAPIVPPVPATTGVFFVDRYGNPYGDPIM